MADPSAGCAVSSSPTSASSTGSVSGWRRVAHVHAEVGVAAAARPPGRGPGTRPSPRSPAPGCRRARPPAAAGQARPPARRAGWRPRTWTVTSATMRCWPTPSGPSNARAPSERGSTAPAALERSRRHDECTDIRAALRSPGPVAHGGRRVPSGWSPGGAVPGSSSVPPATRPKGPRSQTSRTCRQPARMRSPRGPPRPGTAGHPRRRPWRRGPGPARGGATRARA